MHETSENHGDTTGEGLPPERHRETKPVTTPVSPLKSRKVTSVISGEDYVDYVILCERLDFGSNARRLSARDVDDRVIHLALHLLKRKVDQIRQDTGSSFISASVIEKQ